MIQHQFNSSTLSYPEVESSSSLSTRSISSVSSVLPAQTEDHNHIPDVQPCSNRLSCQTERQNGAAALLDGTGKPSLAVTEKSTPEKEDKRSVWTLISDWFIWEALAIILSIALLVAIVGILAEFDQKPQPSWKYVSLNTVVSWLSTVSKACVLYSINEALGQLKWVWFAEKARPLPHLRTFDRASRGFLGSVELVWTLHAKHFAIWGGVATILALAFDPFAQNLIHYYPNLVNDPSQTALITNTTSYNSSGPPYDNGAFFYVDSMLKANVYNSLFNNDPEKPWSIPQYTCSSGNCTWPPIATLEAQAYCSNVTDNLRYTCDYHNSKGDNTHTSNCSAILPPSNLSVSFIIDYDNYGTPIAIGTARPDSAVVYKNSSALTTVQIIASDHFNITGEPLLPGSSKWQARECAIYPTVRSSSATVKNGSYSDTTLATWTDQWSTADSQPPVMHPGVYLNPPWGPELGMQHKQTFFLSMISVAGIDPFFQDFFAGYTKLETRSGIRFVAESDNWYAGSDFIQAMAIGDITGCTSRTAEKLDCAIDNVAAAMSKTFRDSQFTPTDPEAHEARMARGRAMTNTTYISVHWKWIVLPALVWLLGAVTLIGAIWKTQRANVPKWKNDPIPLLLLSDHGVRNIRGGYDKEGIQQVENETAKLYKDGDRMVLHEWFQY